MDIIPLVNQTKQGLIFCVNVFCSIVDSKDPIARKMRLRRRRDQEEADQDQAKILKVYYYLSNYITD